MNTENWLHNWLAENNEFVEMEQQPANDSADNELVTRLLGMQEDDFEQSIKMTEIDNYLSRVTNRKKESSQQETNSEDEDLMFDEEFQTGKRKKKGARKGRKLKRDFGMKGSTTFKLPLEAAQIMGKANMAFVKKEFQVAIELFLEVIRLAPDSHECYYSLGLIFEDLNEIRKALSYFMIAAHLKNDDVGIWSHLVELFK